jgi:hypothetical protein
MAITRAGALQTLKSMRKARTDRKRDTRNAMVAVGAAGTVAYLIGRDIVPPFIGRDPGQTSGGVETPMALGGLALAAGMAGVGGKKWSDDLLFAGIGLVCPAVSARMNALGLQHRS